MAREDILASWNDTPTRRAIVEFVERVTGDGPDHVEPADRIASFDNDGTLWCEKPMPIELGFILQQLAAIAEADASNCDIPMLRYANHATRRGLQLLVLHDDADREFSYTSGAEDALARAAAHDWTVVSMKND
jgi:hypothetical protein